MPDLKLLALDNEDLDVISATTQDAIVRVGDMNPDVLGRSVILNGRPATIVGVAPVHFHGTSG